MVALPYQTKSDNYIHIGVETAELQLGDNLKINLNLKRQSNDNTDITYLILSRGQLVKSGRYKTRGQVLISLIIPITKEMLPSFRIIAYYHTAGNEVVSDSVWVDVKDSCMGSLRLESSRPAPSYEPRRMFGLKVTGDPGATVGLVAVDKGVYVLNNKHRLTQKKVWDIVEKYDTGCTPGGGKDSMGVFFDAGLVFESSTASGTAYRQGICIWRSIDNCRKEFFIDLRLPTLLSVEAAGVRQSSQLQPDHATVRVDLIETEDVCSAASKHSRYRQEVRVGPSTTRSVPFIIIPMREGQFRIEVKAAVKDSSLNDGIMKMLRVVPEGVLVKQPQIVTLDPTHKGQGGKQEETLNSAIPKKDLVPNSPTSTQISVTGREQVAPLVENAISAKSMDTLIQQPSGCGEQNMIRMTLPVIATIYLDKTNQWETVGFQKRAEALQHIKTGYQNQLAYRKKDGSFAVWASHAGSTWLTAYVVKVFAMANEKVAVQNDVICDAVKFLILKAQQPDGLFTEVGRVSHGEMIGDVRGTDSDASMTAFCLIAMQESRRLCTNTVNSLPGSIDKAAAYLEKRLPSLTNPYAVAMTSYALANEGKLNRDILYNFVSPELSHWPVPKGRVYQLEATAYALLALVKTECNHSDFNPFHAFC
ncbi:complement C3-like protein [Lates japonicus]|uniref:Complement C3-like protein n=1 Tax=Lates japonicus TaxID=270547 RepID=A0AAD3MC57_LATJO|nr:complement C3-like protein [Lates japonicus]